MPQTKKVPFILVFLGFLFLLPPCLYAQSTTGCHCFKNRVFEPDDRFAADDYILATSFNSLLANSFNISKGQIIRLKMQGGIAQEDLLLGLKIAKMTGKELVDLLQLRQKKMAWKDILSAPSMQNTIKHDPVLKAVQNGLSTRQAGQKTADELLSKFFRVSLETVTDLRASGLNEKEIALLLILSHTKKQNPKELAALYQKDGKSWSEIAHNFGITPSMAGKIIKNYSTDNKPIEKSQN